MTFSRPFLVCVGFSILGVAASCGQRSLQGGDEAAFPADGNGKGVQQPDGLDSSGSDADSTPTEAVEPSPNAQATLPSGGTAPGASSNPVNDGSRASGTSNESGPASGVGSGADGGPAANMEPKPGSGSGMVATPGTPTGNTPPPTPSVPATPAGAESVPAFVAQGKMMRTLISCDDGQSWVADQSMDDSTRCFLSGGPDCDHHQGNGRGLAYGMGWIYSAFGWGSPGIVRRSRDGVAWEKVRDTMQVNNVFGGLAFGNGIVSGGKSPFTYSDDEGLSWKTRAAVQGDTGNLREIYFVPTGATAGNFVNVGDKLTVYTADSGATWKTATRDDGCEGGKFAHGNGVSLIFVGHKDKQCRSTDGGATWRLADAPDDPKNVVWNGSRFLAYAGNKAYESSDGLSWGAAKPLTGAPGLAHVAYHPATGTYVGIQEGWGSWYEKQKFYRSKDGLTWTLLPDSKAKGGHPITYVIPAFVRKSAQCR